MRNRFLLLLATILIPVTILVSSFTASKKSPRVLVFCKTSGYHHQSIPDGIEAIRAIGKENGFAVDTTTDSTWFRKEVLKKYAAVVFLNTTGNVLGPDQEAAFQQYIHQGGGYVGVHAATDTEYGWEWYGRLAGAYFESHPKQQQARLLVIDHQHAASKGLPDEWVRFDEWYNFKNINPSLHVLIKIDEKSYTGGKNGDYHPMSWWHNFEGGRAFYTALGHTAESYKDPLYLGHLKGGILYAIGREGREMKKSAR